MEFLDIDSPIRKRIDDITRSVVVQEGIKDIKTFSGEVYREIGDKTKGINEFTDPEKQKLDNILAKELKDYKYGKKDNTPGDQRANKETKKTK